MSIENPVRALAFCWRIERADGAGIALTSHDRPLTVGGISYRSDPGVVPSSITRSLGLEPDASEISGALSSAALDDADLGLGRWDGARVHLAAVDWQDEAAAPIPLLAGQLGDIAISGDSFAAELQGAASRLDEPVCPSTSPECRAELGDRRCRVDLAGRSLRAKVLSADGAMLTLDRSLDDRFLFGRLRYLSGANCGRATTMLGVDGATLRVRDLPRASVEPGCSVEVREGCDKRFQTCIERFGNAANFRGEPHLPGNDLLTRYPGS